MDAGLLRVYVRLGGVRRAQLPQQQASRRVAAMLWRVFLAGLVHRIAPDKIVELVPVPGRTFQQVRADEDIQRMPWGDLSGKGARSCLTEVRAWMQRERSEYPGRRFWKSLIGPRKHRVREDGLIPLCMLVDGERPPQRGLPA